MKEIKEQLKQETLEEAVKRVFKEYSNNTSLAEDHYDYMMDKEDFKEASLEILEWQAERMFSEEDMREAFKANYTPFSATNIGDLEQDFQKWFGQYKKK